MVVSHPVDNKVSLALEPSLYVLGSLVTLACFDMFGLCSKLQIARILARPLHASDRFCRWQTVVLPSASGMLIMSHDVVQHVRGNTTPCWLFRLRAVEQLTFWDIPNQTAALKRQ